MVKGEMALILEGAGVACDLLVFFWPPGGGGEFGDYQIIWTKKSHLISSHRLSLITKHLIRCSN